MIQEEQKLEIRATRRPTGNLRDHMIHVRAPVTRRAIRHNLLHQQTRKKYVRTLYGLARAASTTKQYRSVYRLGFNHFFPQATARSPQIAKAL